MTVNIIAENQEVVVIPSSDDIQIHASNPSPRIIPTNDSVIVLVENQDIQIQPSNDSVYVVIQNSPVTTVIGQGSTADEKVKVSAVDTTPSYLQSKLVAGSNITITKNNTGANETLTIASTSSGGGTWGSITGTLSNQTDLQNALDAKLNLSGSNANQDIDIGAYSLNAASIKVNGTNGAGHIHLKHQASDATSQANSTTLFANSAGDLKWKNDSLYYTTLSTSGNTANRVYTFPDASGTVALISDLSGFIDGSLTANQLVYGIDSNTIGSLTTATYPSLTEISYVKGVTSAIQTQLDGKVDENAPITGATKTKITYDAKGLVTAGADATTADIADSSNKRYVTDAQLTVIGNTSGVNTGDQDLSAYATTSYVNSGLAGKQETLISGTNIKTINSNSLLGSGDLVISASPVGSTGNIQFNNGGAFAATTNLDWDNTLKNLYINSTSSSELITNGTFTGSATGWALATGWVYSSNAVSKTSNGVGTLQPSTPLPTVFANQRYDYSVVISALTAGSVVLSCGGVTLATITANGTYSGSFLATSNANLVFTPSNTARLTVDNVSLTRRIGGKAVVGNTYANESTVFQPALGASTPTDAFIADNPTPATNSLQQVSPTVRWKARGWNTNSSQSSDVGFRSFVVPNGAAIVPSGTWKLQGNTGDGTTWFDLLTVNSATVGQGSSIGFHASTVQSNSVPGTQRIASFNNTGSNTWIDFNFSGTSKSHIGAENGGQINIWTSGNNYLALYNKNTGNLYNFNTPTQFGHYGSGAFAVSVNAGSTNVATSTLQSQGGTALKVKRITANATLDDSATHWLIDATTAAACTGTPTYNCSHWTNQTDCELRDSHGGCSWFSGYSCGEFNYESGMGVCASTSGCSVATTSCAGAGDESTCLAQDDAYGGSCVWTNSPISCAGLDESTCGATTGCTVNYGYCTNNYTSCSWNGSSCDGSGSCSSYGDESSCNAATYWTSCSGGGSCTSLPDETSCTSYSYFDNCSGSYDSYSCTGTYNTGICNGNYGAACQGTSSCSGIDDSSSCGGEAGCTWSSVLVATLPNGENCPDRTYWIYNDSSGGADVQLVPHSGQTVDGSSSYTLASYKDWIHIAYYKITANCSGLPNEAACLAQSGCSASYTNCSWDGAACTGGAGCSAYIDEGSCTAATYYSSCSGTYATSKNWYKFGS